MIKLQIGNKTYYNNGKAERMDAAPFLENSRTFVPIRFIAEALGCTVKWNDLTRTVTITGKSEPVYFDTANECAIDWGMKFNNLSIGLHKELGSSIYKCDKGYYYTFPNIGQSNSVTCSVDNSKNKRVAVIHSHASTGCGTQKGDKISSTDVSLAKTLKCDNYMVSPCGTLEVYRHDTKRYENISDCMPYDRRALKKLQTSWGYGNMKKNDEFFKSYPIGTVSIEADFYNKLFADGKQFPLFDD